MQTYLVSNLLRTNTSRVGLLFCLAILSCPKLSASENLETHSKDSLYANWAKSKSTLPTLFYELADFNDYNERVEVESLIRMYGIGGIVVSNGRIDQLQKWMRNNQNWRGQPLLNIAKVDRVFELPFSELQKYPTQLEVECWMNDSLVFWLGQAHAIDLKEMGFGMIQFSDVPDYYSSHEMQKVDFYLKGIESQQLSYSFGKQSKTNANNENLFSHSKPDILNLNRIAEDGELAKKQIKDYRKDTKDKRIVWAYATNSEKSLQQVERGLGIVVLPQKNEPQKIINKLLVEDVPSKKYYKQQVKKYFNLMHATHTDVTPIKKNLLLSEASDFTRNSITLIQDPYQIFPLADLSARKIYVFSKDSKVKERVDKFKVSDWLVSNDVMDNLDSLAEALPLEAIVVADLSEIHGDTLKAAVQKFDILNQYRPVVLLFDEHQELIKQEEITSAIIWSPSFFEESSILKVEMLFGVHAINGKLPGYFQNDQSRKGILTQSNKRLSYMRFNSEKVNQERLDQIDSLVKGAIKEQMMPGCQIMMLKEGHVVYDKSFGYLTYDSLMPVHWNHIYDIASVTKTVATVPALMERMDEGRLKINSSIGEYLPGIDSSKARLELADILNHQSGLKSYLPFWRNAKYFADSANFLYKKRKWRNRYSYHSINWEDSIQSWIGSSRYNSLSNKDGTYRYLYSDLGFMLMKDLVEENCECSFDQTLYERVYRPLGMDLTTFNPLQKIAKGQIAPTEQDQFFRSDLLQGVVHDKNAAILGGVSGHAGLFSNANDLAKYMQMLIQGGYYGGVQYFSDSVINVFTSKKNENDRRAMGWDKPYESVGNASKYASELSYGHSGFTGTLVWADPKYEMVYIFLSNRIYPDPQNYKLIQSNIRTKIHDLMYESFLNLEPKTNPGS